MTNTNSSKITLSEAKELTHLNLVSARDISSELGRTYHSMEEDSESKSHASARSQGVEYFCSIGYQVFPEGVGIQGIFTLADFLAIREGRIVFVEVLSDTNIVEKLLKGNLNCRDSVSFVSFFSRVQKDPMHPSRLPQNVQ